MTIPLRFTRLVVLVSALALSSTACIDDEVSDPVAPEFGVLSANSSQPSHLEVYTQNMFLGGDTGPLFSLKLSDPAALPSVIQATNVFWAQVQASNIEERASAIVDEIDLRRPDVVALQEAVGYATGDLDLKPGGGFTPTAAGPDLLLAVITELAVRDLPYGIGAMQLTTQIALPLGPPDETFVAPGLGVQDRVVMLKHDEVKVTRTDMGLYAARIPLGPVDIVRGWVRVTTERKGVETHFVATHLETQGDGPADPIRAVHNGQALELQGYIDEALAGSNVVLMGDLNSDAAADETAPSWTPTYGNLIAGGFTDIWEVAQRRGSDSGVTCCQADGDEPRTPDERIDFVLFRPASPATDNGKHKGHYLAEIVGSEDADRTTSGLWPSDHAGISASIKAPNSMR